MDLDLSYLMGRTTVDLKPCRFLLAGGQEREE